MIMSLDLERLLFRFFLFLLIARFLRLYALINVFNPSDHEHVSEEDDGGDVGRAPGPGPGPPHGT